MYIYSVYVGKYLANMRSKPRSEVERKDIVSHTAYRHTDRQCLSKVIRQTGILEDGV